MFYLWTHVDSISRVFLPPLFPTTAHGLIAVSLSEYFCLSRRFIQYWSNWIKQVRGDFPWTARLVIKTGRVALGLFFEKLFNCKVNSKLIGKTTTEKSVSADLEPKAIDIVLVQSACDRFNIGTPIMTSTQTECRTKYFSFDVWLPTKMSFIWNLTEWCF